MNVEIKGTHGYHPGESTREHIEKKLVRLKHVEEHIADLHVVMDREAHGEYRAESTIHFRWGTMGHIKVSDRDLFKGIDLLFDKIVAKTKKEIDKIRER